MSPKLLAFTTNVISFTRENVCLVDRLSTIKDKGIENIVSFNHPILKGDGIDYLKQYLTNGANNFDLGCNTILTFYEETNETRFNRFDRLWNFTNSRIEYVKIKYYCILTKSSKNVMKYHSSKMPGQNVPAHVLNTIPKVFLPMLVNPELYDSATKFSNLSGDTSFYTMYI